MKLLVFIEGTDFEGEVDGIPTRLGFHAHREVEALTADSIDRNLLFQSILQELELDGLRTTPKSEIRILEVRLRNSTDDRQFIGFTFFMQDSWLKRALSKLPFWRSSN